VVVALLTVEESDELDLERESKACRSTGIEYCSFPMVDHGGSGCAGICGTAAATLSLEAGKDRVIRCRQGIGRAGRVAIAVLRKNGRSLEEATLMVSTARGVHVPETREQAEWRGSFAGAF